MKLKQIHQTTIEPKAPYNFKYSVQNPSYFPTNLHRETASTKWFTMRWQGKPLGVRLANKGAVGKPVVELTIYATETLCVDLVLKELEYRFEWFEDYSEFYALVKNDSKLAPLLPKFKGMRTLCAEGLYDYLMIAIPIQNANAKWSAKMMRAMLENYGDLLEFDNQQLYCFWSPERLLKVPEAELRALKVGYRAKSFLRASQDFLKLDEFEMRNLDNAALKKTLLSIYGVGPASLDYLMQDVFHRRDALNTVPPWEAKIYSRILGINSVDASRILDFVKQRYGRWRAIAMHYLFMDLSWRHKEKRIDWLEKLLPF